MEATLPPRVTKLENLSASCQEAMVLNSRREKPPLSFYKVNIDVVFIPLFRSTRVGKIIPNDLQKLIT